MITSEVTSKCHADRWQCWVKKALLMLGILAVSTVQAWTLDTLLSLPLERLMELQLTAQRTAAGHSEQNLRTGAGRGQAGEHVA